MHSATPVLHRWRRTARSLTRLRLAFTGRALVHEPSAFAFIGIIRPHAAGLVDEAARDQPCRRSAIKKGGHDARLALARRSAIAGFRSSESLGLLRKGLTPIRKGQLGQLTETHLRTSPAQSQQESRHRVRRAFRGFFSPWYRERILKGTSLGSLPTLWPPSA